MADRKPTALYFTTVVAIERDLAVLGGHLYMEGANPTITRLVMCSSTKWAHLGDLPDVAYAATRIPGNALRPRGTLCVMGRTGLYREIVSGAPPADIRLPGIDALYLMDLRHVDGNLYTCGVQDQMWRGNGRVWDRVDQGLFVPFAGRVDRRLESIDGFAADDLYAVGSGGRVWHWNGRAWTRLDVPTNVNLNIVLCSRGGDVYIGGTHGLIVRGRRDRPWQDLSDTEICPDAIEDFTEFGGVVYAAGTTRLIRIDDAGLNVVDVPVEGEAGFYALDSVAEAMWCTGNEVILRFDGGGWEQFVCPDNR